MMSCQLAWLNMHQGHQCNVEFSFPWQIVKYAKLPVMKTQNGISCSSLSFLFLFPAKIKLGINYSMDCLEDLDTSIWIGTCASLTIRHLINPIVEWTKEGVVQHLRVVFPNFDFPNTTLLGPLRIILAPN
jgi:hypothetical protein